MSKSTTPITHVFVTLEKAFAETISTPNGMKLYIDSRWNKSHHVSVTGKVHSLPINPNSKDKDVVSKLQVGDEVCFSFRVCDIEHIVTDGYFTEVTDKESKLFKRFANGKGEWLTIVAMQKTNNFTMWVGTHVDSRGELVDGIQGSESEVQAWLTKRPLSNQDRYKFRNLITIDGQDVWKVRVDEIFAKKVGDDIISVGNRLMLKPIDIDIKHRLEIMKGIHIPASSVVKRYFDRATIQHDYAPLGIKKGDCVSFQEQFCETYEFFGQQYFLLKPNRALGIWDNINYN